ncbi:Bug family tripartite tricarboxylate transporter substrate binding protein [Variovorax ginsengisoli]|uniref:Tripartite-type tricarboxylate transporter receptor subunit TctC n=1 Tax=Variovorax ginsengisoli TaxID=363844 RepID=A0ABT9SEZ7_9BURK|nr:tripartite tricarboxylate transporter substrate binding protein [Variovorax ginsengisoli]MDP9902937.1 tripartite-type tricarboxylate transporter receptor subunit TctC [Variovorax ginsengisoli]
MHLIQRSLALAATSLALSASAQDYPNKPIRIIVPFPAGGGTDVIARDVTNQLTTALGWAFVVENRPGSGGNLGVDAAAKSKADGYTLALGQSSNLAVNPTLYSKMPYDVMKDIVPVALVASAPILIVVAADSPYKTLGEIVAAVKAKPGSLNFASPGNGTVTHLTGELFQRRAGVKFTHVPYKGASQAVTDLIGGQVQLYGSTVPTLLSQIRNGRIRALAITSKTRSADLPDVPTVAESGYKDFESVTWFGFVGPAGIPKPVVAKLNTEINKALQSPELKKRLNEQGATVLGGSADEFAELIKTDIGVWAPIIKQSGAKLD